jgi:hypothetical protein
MNSKQAECHILQDIAGTPSARYYTDYVRFEVFTAMIMKNVFWDIKPSPYFTGDTLRLHYRAQPVNAM